MIDRRAIMSRYLRREGQQFPKVPNERREISTEHFEFCRCWHDGSPASQLRTRWTCDYPRLRDFFSTYPHLRRRRVGELQADDE